MKIFELIINEDDDLSGTSLLSLVKDPATEITFEIFSKGEAHDCSLHDHDFSMEDLSVLDDLGIEVSPEAFKGCIVSPIEITLTSEGFVSVPPISSNPRQFDIKSADQEEGSSITRFLYVVDTSLGSPLIATSRPLCRKMIFANRVFSRNDIDLMAQKLSSASDTFKLVYRKNTYPSVDFYQYKSGKFCRHRWFQIQFPLKEGETMEEGLKRIPIKADQTRGAIRLGGDGSRPFQSEWSLDPPKNSSFSKYGTDPIAFHMGVFIYHDRFSCLVAEPKASKLTKVKICYDDDDCIIGWAPLEITKDYYEETAEVMEYFDVRQTFSKIPDYMRDAAKRATDYAEENGWGDCGTDVGKRRANDLADASYTPSMDILSRMYSYGSRHKVDYESSGSIDEGCGYLMMLSWGFTPSTYDASISWLEGQLEKSTELNVMMSSNEYEGDITAVVFQPNQKIYRYDNESGNGYFVFMSRETIRKMLMKFQRTKVGKGGVVNLEHSGYIFKPEDVYTYENWLVGDEPEHDKSYKIFGRTFEAGTWITTIHFQDKRVFQEFVVSNKTTGISLEGMFQEVPFNFAEGMPHYTEDGELYTGKTHTHNGRLMTGETHTEDSEYLYHKGELAEVGERGGIKKSPKAPKSDTPNKDPKGEGSSKGDASGKRGAKVDDATEKTLQKKVDDFNEKDSNTKNGRATLGALKSVYQRGLGAYNTSHSPQVRSAKQWAMARVNAFLYLIKNGRPENKKYITDYDLLPSKHPKSLEAERQEMEAGITLDKLKNMIEEISRKHL